MRMYAICPFCLKATRLRKRKDFESFTGEEQVAHYKTEHPEKLTEPFGVPYYRTVLR